MSNWPNNFDLSKPNWTGRTQRSIAGYQPQKDEPSVVVQALGALLVLAFFMALAFVL